MIKTFLVNFVVVFLFLAWNAASVVLIILGVNGEGLSLFLAGFIMLVSGIAMIITTISKDSSK